MKKVILFILISISSFAYSQQLDWLKTEHYECSTEAQGVALDGSGNIFLSGAFGKSFSGNQTGSHGYYIHKYTAAGALLWADTAQAKGGAFSCGVVVDASGNAYIALYATGYDSIRIGNNKYYCGINMYLVKYNSTGQIQWVKFQGNASQPRDMATDASGFIYVSGYRSGGAFTTKYDQAGNLVADFNGGSYNISLDAQNNLYFPTGKMSSTGTVLWSIQNGGSTVIAADKSGNTYRSDKGSMGISTLAKLSPNGQAVWSFTVPYQGGSAIHCDTVTNMVYVSGITTTTNNPNYIGNLTAEGMVLNKYDSNGNQLWSWHMSNPINGYPNFYYNPEGTIQNVNGVVYFSGYKSYSCSEAFLVKLTQPDPTTALYEHKQDYSITISPNPSSSEFLISVKTRGKESLTIKVMDALGKLLYTKKEILISHDLREILDLSNYPKGIYFVQINTGSTSEVRKIVLE